MARGWESKNVEEQQAETLRGRDDRRAPALTPEQQAVKERAETLRLAHARTEAALAAARTHAHRDMLRMQLEAIRRDIDALGRST